MDSAAEFWTLIGALVLGGVGYLIGAKRVIDWLTGLITGRGKNDDPK